MLDVAYPELFLSLQFSQRGKPTNKIMLFAISTVHAIRHAIGTSCYLLFQWHVMLFQWNGTTTVFVQHYY